MPGAAGGDVEEGPAAAAEFPMVLVQIPMYNEREVSRRRFQNLCFSLLSV